ncbi:hypothetical protein T484DRAFT_1754844 [Baffinella frigidus]|nr:hypothetical protein T484DRAFT_1754844 [Cryptophyta sp. CCMP2293]
MARRAIVPLLALLLIVVEGSVSSSCRSNLPFFGIHLRRTTQERIRPPSRRIQHVAPGAASFLAETDPCFRSVCVCPDMRTHRAPKRRRAGEASEVERVWTTTRPERCSRHPSPGRHHQPVANSPPPPN